MRSRLKGGCTVESPSYLIEIRPSLRWAFIPLNGAPRHRDSQDWLPHQLCAALPLRTSSRWPGLARMMNLRESNARQGGRTESLPPTSVLEGEAKLELNAAHRRGAGYGAEACVLR